MCGNSSLEACRYDSSHGHDDNDNDDSDSDSDNDEEDDEDDEDENDDDSQCHCPFQRSAPPYVSETTRKATSLENPNIDGNNEETSLEETTEDYWAGSGSGPEDEQSLQNETREALTHEASDHDAKLTRILQG
ncbi:hypothetical protein HZH66_004479 [Vespula vulgaris]|uniref:Uncharacterized protein n=1 Tax=Vespula vulgaris TaxID=7454 RepID=A0A834NFJ2_VESVU|nr:hypothetical protein HZH66_004479 [Vespula vulgaris]